MVVAIGMIFYSKKDTRIVYNADISSGAPKIWEEIDNDGDGLLDWEEILWGTDPYRDRSNDEGLSDYEFVKQKKESGELSSNQSKSKTASSYSTSSYTERLGIDLFAEYTNLKNSGTFDQSSINSSANQIVSNFSLPNQKRYLRTDIKTIFKDEEIERMVVYADRLMNIRNKYYRTYSEDPIRASGTVGPVGTILPADKLLRAGDLYYKLAEEIMALEVPEGLVGPHLVLANSYKDSGFGFSQMGENLKNDPLKAILGLETHTRAQVAESEAINNIILFLSKNGINTTIPNEQV